MKEKFNDIIHSKKIIVILIVVLIVLVGVASTYAWFTWSSTNNTSLTMSIGELADVTFSSGNDISTSTLAPVFNYTDGEKTTFIISNKSDTNIKYKILLNITSIDNELKSNNLKYKLLSDDNIIKEGDFTNIEDQNILYEGELSKGKASYTFYLYIDGNLDNSLDLINKSINGNITVEAEEDKGNLATYITNLYTNADKTTITNNSITYNYATEVGLMNDRLGSMSTGIDDGNIRYYGASPNNYIYFNCSDYSNQSDTTCETWRIIGVFNGKVKIMRNESIGSYSWDNKGTSSGAESEYGKNNWSDARLMKMLNAGYESETGGSLYWNRQNGTCYSGTPADTTTTCDMSSIGLKNDITRNMISETTYSLLGWNTNKIYSDQMYNYERTTGSVYNETTRDKSWTGKIALAYPSDYGYAADLSQCSQTLYDYDNSTCTSNNWMKAILGTSSYGWLLTPNSGYSGYAWLVLSAGFVYNSSYAYDAFGAAPVLYLGSELEIKAGDGSNSAPYQLSA